MSIQKARVDMIEAIGVLEDAREATSRTQVKTAELPAPYQGQIDAKAAAEQEITSIRDDLASLLGRMASLGKILQHGEESATAASNLLRESSGSAGTAQFIVEGALAPVTRAVGEEYANTVLSPVLEATKAPWISLNKAWDQAPSIVLGFAAASTSLDRITELTNQLNGETEKCQAGIRSIGITDGLTAIDPTYPAIAIKQVEDADSAIIAATKELESRQGRLNS